MTPIRCLIASFFLFAFPALAPAVELNPPVPVNSTTIRRDFIVGRITRYDDNAFTYVDPRHETHTIPWSDLDPAHQYSMHEQIWGRGTADQWLGFGKHLLAMTNGNVPADKAFTRALRLDPSLKDKIDAIKQGKDTDQPAASPSSSPPLSPGQAGDEGDSQPTTAASSAPWPALSESDQLAAIRDCKSALDEIRQKLDPNLALYETKYFLFASDLQPAEARRWADVLDRMYQRLAELFAVPPGKNIWRGKALVIVFSERNTYNKFEQQFYHNDASNTGGICHALPDGDVKIAFYRGADDQRFAHVLVHESTHGFLHRYRSPIHIPSWANEGLAESIAYDLVPAPGLVASAKADARADLQTHKNLADIFTADHIANSRYPTCFVLTDMLIQKDKRLRRLHQRHQGRPEPRAQPP